MFYQPCAGGSSAPRDKKLAIPHLLLGIEFSLLEVSPTVSVLL